MSWKDAIYTDEERRERCACGKIMFSKKTAITKKHHLERLGQERLRVYQCNKSDCWHLTKSTHYDGKRMM